MYTRLLRTYTKQTLLTSLCVGVDLVCVWSGSWWCSLLTDRCLFLDVLHIWRCLVAASANWRLDLIPAGNTLITWSHPTSADQTSADQLLMHHWLHVTWHEVWNGVFLQPWRNTERNCGWHSMTGSMPCITHSSITDNSHVSHSHCDKWITNISLDFWPEAPPATLNILTIQTFQSRHFRGS